MLCSACGKPPTISGRKLLKCRQCKCALYHDASCQRQDWKCHKKVCSRIASFVVPLSQISKNEGVCNQWWASVAEGDLKGHEIQWREGDRLWYNQKYLEAVKCFQSSLEPFSKSWAHWMGVCGGDIAEALNSRSSANDDADSASTSFVGTDNVVKQRQLLGLARRLLFCAYCEIDGQFIDSGRQRLAQCLAILHFLSLEGWTKEAQTTWDDAWMELVLSMEEVDDERKFAKAVAAFALEEMPCGRISKPCSWTDAWQRPGFMVPLLAGKGKPFVSRDSHPLWCRELEDNFQTILEEYQNIQNHAIGWSKVGRGDRCSGMTDHRVVEGQDWSEFVLFGTGSQEHDSRIAKTRSLIRQIVPEAVSLAEEGGGEVIFSRLAPRTSIQSHCGPTNLRLTAHLGLVVPNNSCRIRVANDWHSWEYGKIILFDDSFEHEVRNDTNEERVVLLMRLWHPLLPASGQHSALLEAGHSKEEAIQKRYHPPHSNKI